MEMIKRFLRYILPESSVKTGPTVPEPLELDETLSRFLFAKHFNAAGIKHQAFLPARNLETSVFRKSRMSTTEYIQTKETIESARSLKENRKMRIKATALLQVSKISEETNLKIEPEEQDHKWHANIIGWPSSDKKDEQISIAQQLARISIREP